MTSQNVININVIIKNEILVHFFLKVSFFRIWFLQINVKIKYGYSIKGFRCGAPFVHFSSKFPKKDDWPQFLWRHITPPLLMSLGDNRPPLNYWLLTHCNIKLFSLFFVIISINSVGIDIILDDCYFPFFLFIVLRVWKFLQVSFC